MTISAFYFDFVTAKLLGSEKWRRSLLLKFPDDQRNANAADRLAALAKTDIATVTKTAWAGVEPHLGQHYLSEALNQVNRSVGFHIRPRDFNEYLTHVAASAEAFGLPVLIGGAQ